MHNKGLTKLQEECGKLIQIAAKKAAFINTDKHPDGRGSMANRLEEEMGDVIGAILKVSSNLNLSITNITRRAEEKLALFNSWDAQPVDTTTGEAHG